MKIKKIEIQKYKIPLTTHSDREGALVKFYTDQSISYGEIAPLPNWSTETLTDALNQFKTFENELLNTNWNEKAYQDFFQQNQLMPSVSFAIDSGLLTLLNPIKSIRVSVSALLMGNVDNILSLAQQRKTEGYKSAKLKISQLTLDEAKTVILKLKNDFKLRIDVNRAWNPDECDHFFSNFEKNDFDYIEEPYKNPKNLTNFDFPLAVDESFPVDLTLDELKALPSLKAIIYKPTIQGGFQSCLELYQFAQKHNKKFILSSAFESNVGLGLIADMAQRLKLPDPIGIGTYHYLKELITPNQYTLNGSNLIFN